MRPTLTRSMIYRARTTPRRPFDARREGSRLAAFNELMCACDPGLGGLGLTSSGSAWGGTAQTGVTGAASLASKSAGAAGGAAGVYNAYQSRDVKAGVVSGAAAGSAFGPWGAAIGAVIGGVAASLKGRQSKASASDQNAGRQVREIYRTQVMDKVLGRDIPFDAYRDLIVGSQAMGAMCCGFPENYDKKYERIRGSIEKLAAMAKSTAVGSPIKFEVPNVGIKEDKGNYQTVTAANPGPDAKALLGLWLPAARLGTHKETGTVGSTDPVNLGIFRDLIDYYLGQTAPIPPWAPLIYRQPPPAVVAAAAAPPPSSSSSDAQLQAALNAAPRGSAQWQEINREIARRAALNKPLIIPAPTAAAPTPVPAPVPVVPPPAPSAPAPVVPNLTPAVVDNTSVLIKQLLEQGASQQSAVTQALQSLAQQGVTPTPQVQQAVQSQVAAEASSSSTGTGIVVAAVAALFGIGLLSRSRAR